MFFLLETLFRASSSHSIPFPSPCPVLYTWNFFVSNIESQVLHGKKDGDLYLFFQHSEAEVKAEAGDFSIMQLIHPPPFQTMCTPPSVTLLSTFPGLRRGKQPTSKISKFGKEKGVLQEEKVVGEENECTWFGRRLGGWINCMMEKSPVSALT